MFSLLTHFKPDGMQFVGTTTITVIVLLKLPILKAPGDGPFRTFIILRLNERASL